tara:strand:- start:46 stop:366 length:321 start_codon:yes stop_codon:yes gene_type:complete
MNQLNNNFQIFISGIKNKTIVYEISLSDSTNKIKNYLLEKHNINPEYYYILAGCKILDNHRFKTFQDFNDYVDPNYRIHRDMTFTVHFRSCPPKTKIDNSRKEVLI